MIVLNDNIEAKAASVLLQIASFVLIRSRVTRQQIAREFDISPASVTHHTRKLIETGILKATPIQVEHSKKPVEMLAVNPECGDGLSIYLDANGAVVEQARSDASHGKVFRVEASDNTQQALIKTLASCMSPDCLEKFVPGKTVISLTVKGVVDPRARLIFSIEGIKDWQPCQPTMFLEEFYKYTQNNKTLHTWIMAKCKGYARSVRQYDRVGYVELSNGTMHMASINSRCVDFGNYGTQGCFLHRKAYTGEKNCYCGRKGCFSTYLAEEKWEPEVIAPAINSICRELAIDRIAVDIENNPFSKEALAEHIDSARFDLIANSSDYLEKGTRVICAEQMLQTNIKKECSKA